MWRPCGTGRTQTAGLEAGRSRHARCGRCCPARLGKTPPGSITGRYRPIDCAHRTSPAPAPRPAVGYRAGSIPLGILPSDLRTGVVRTLGGRTSTNNLYASRSCLRASFEKAYGPLARLRSPPGHRGQTPQPAGHGGRPLEDYIRAVSPRRFQRAGRPPRPRRGRLSAAGRWGRPPVALPGEELTARRPGC